MVGRVCRGVDGHTANFGLERICYEKSLCNEVPGAIAHDPKFPDWRVAARLALHG